MLYNPVLVFQKHRVIEHDDAKVRHHSFSEQRDKTVMQFVTCLKKHCHSYDIIQKEA